jgi:hypothetical protein
MFDSERARRVQAVLRELVDPDDLRDAKLMHHVPLSFVLITEVLDPHELRPGRAIRRAIVTDQSKEIEARIAESFIAWPPEICDRPSVSDALAKRANALIRSWSKDSGAYVRVRCEHGRDEIAFVRLGDRPAFVLLEARRLLGYRERRHTWLQGRSLLFF